MFANLLRRLAGCHQAGASAGLVPPAGDTIAPEKPRRVAAR
jgi:hypothetical protein